MVEKEKNDLIVMLTHKEKAMSHLIAVAFDDEFKAKHVRLDLIRMQRKDEAGNRRSLCGVMPWLGLFLTISLNWQLIKYLNLSRNFNGRKHLQKAPHVIGS